MASEFTVTHPIAEARFLEFGANIEVQPNVLVGVVPGRKIEDLHLVIGSGARLRSGTVIYAGSRIGEKLETGHGVVIREECVIGDRFQIWNNSTVDYGCAIGDGVKVHASCYLAQFTVLEDGVFLAPGVITANDPHPLCGACMKGPTVKRMARIGVNATLCFGRDIPLDPDVPDRAVVVGNPARVVGKVEDLECKVGMVAKPYPIPPVE
jgi:acetyltransferase-like isoleucine patch superfamily enzyme